LPKQRFVHILEVFLQGEDLSLVVEVADIAYDFFKLVTDHYIELKKLTLQLLKGIAFLEHEHVNYRLLHAFLDYPS